MLFEHQQHRQRDLNLEQIHVRLEMDVQAPLLQRAFAACLRRHAALRVGFSVDGGGEPSQELGDAVLVPLQVDDRGTCPGPEADAEVTNFLAADRTRGFDLADPPLMRLQLLRFGSARSDLVWSFPHLLLDGRSFPIVLGEVLRDYEVLAAGGQLDESPAADLRAAHLEAIDRVDRDAARQFWTEQLRGIAPPDLPFDPPEAHAGTPGRCVTRLSQTRTSALRDLGESVGGHLGTSIQAAFALLLARLSGRAGVVFGAARACRHAVAGAAEVPGVFLNTLPVAARCRDDLRLVELCAALRRADLATRPFELSPLVEVQRWAGVSPGESLFGSILIYDHLSLDGQMRALGVPAQPSGFHLHERTGYPLTLYAYGGDQLELQLQFEPEHLSEADATRCLEWLVHLLGIFAEDPQRRLDTVDLIDPRAAAQLASWNDTGGPVPAEMVPVAIRARAARQPQAPALSFREQTLSYAELLGRAEAVAAALQREGCGPEDLVGLYAERSVEMLVGALGVLLAGAAYLPLDPEYPADRTAFILQDATTKVLLTQSQLAAQVPDHPCVRSIEVLAASPGRPEPVSTQPEHLAYSIYTSGSTGRPKGVLLEHRNLANFCAAMDRWIPDAEGGVWLAVTSMSFDISILELLWTLRQGMHVVLHEDQVRLARAQALGGTASLEFSLMYFADAAAFDEGDKYRLLMEGARYADTHGFAAVWTPERHFHEFGGLYPNPALTSAALSQVTERISLRAGSVVLPLHHPARVAEEWAFADNLSKGRVAVAFASGWHERDFVLRPENHADAKAAMLQGIQEVRALWRGETVEFEGPQGRRHAIRTLPRPVQKDLPVWVTAAGNPETFRSAGEIGANILTHLLGQDLEEVASKIRVYQDAWRAAGHPGQGRVTMMLHTFLGDRDEETREQVYQPMKNYLSSAMGLVRNFAKNWTAFKRGKDGQIVDAGIDLDELSEAEREDLLEFAFARFYETSTLFGDLTRAESLARRLHEVGVHEIACLIDFGVPVETTLAHLPYIDRLRQRFVVAPPTVAEGSVAAQIRKFGVTHMQCTPSLAAVLVKDGPTAAALGELRTLLVGGENLTPRLARELRATGLGRLCNMYGPTETCIWSTCEDIDEPGESCSIGRPILNTQVFVADAEGRPLPPGLSGELWIGGAGVARGYHRRPDLNAERFATPGGRFAEYGRCYRTGDLVRLRADGALEFIGRLDQQVKLRGHRIELGEIENVICEHEMVAEAAVVLNDLDGDARLCAYVVPSGAGVRLPALRTFLEERLPEVMVPAHLEELAALPQTPNKKIDRKALPQPTLIPNAPSGQPAATDLVETLQQIWREVLRVEEVSVDDNFFDLGGHSLLAVQVHRRIESLAPGRSSILDLFQYPNIRRLAERLTAVGAVAGPMGSAPAPAREGTARGRDRAAKRRQARRPRS